MNYDASFYNMIRPGVQESARVVVPLLAQIFEPISIIDVGCGEGWWAYEFSQNDPDNFVLGIDNGFIPTSPLGDRFQAVDLTKPFPDLGYYDLALCLEVAEHLPATRAEGFIKDLCGLAPDIVFSAAIPGQGGVGHINEQWPIYWANLFHDNGFDTSGALRWHIWADDRIENWYRQNLLVATKRPEQYPDLFDHPASEPFSVVHPVLYDTRREH